MARHLILLLAAALSLTFGACTTTSGASQSVPSVVGVWRLVSFDTQVDGSPPAPYWAKPEGHLVITPKRLITVLTAGDRRQPDMADAAGMAEAFKTVIAYDGRYRIEGNRLITTVDESAIPAWRGSEQGRVIKFEGGHLVLTSVPAPVPGDPSKMIVARLVWERAD